MAMYLPCRENVTRRGIGHVHRYYSRVAVNGELKLSVNFLLVRLSISQKA